MSFLSSTDLDLQTFVDGFILKGMIIYSEI